MDKIKINTQVVVMRKFVKQAKIRVINRYVKEIKLLQNRKGNENQVSKCKRKAERLLLEIAILKKIKPDSVSKMALAKAKDWKTVLKQKDVPLEERCFANLANYESVQAEVEKFHSANSYLVPKIITLVQEWEEKANLISQSPQKDKKALKNNKAFEKSGKEREVFQIKAKPETENAQPKKIQHIVKKPLENEDSEFNDKDNVSDSSSDDVDETVVENEHHSEKDNLNVINSQKELTRSKNIESNLNPCETDSTSSELDEDESVTQSSENEDCSESPQKSLETVNETIASQKSALKAKSVKKNPENSNMSLETNIITAKQPTFQRSLSPDPNSTKAVTLLNLNEMLDMDEIPIDNNRTVVATVEETCKRKRDTFFLTGNGEDMSENSDNEDSDEDRQETNLSPKKKKPHNAFNKKGNFNEGFKNENGFKNKRNFRDSPHGQKFGFGEKSFNKSGKEFNSKKQFGKSERNQGRLENNFNSFEKRDRRQENQFNKSKDRNTKDVNNRTEGKPFRTPGKFFEKNMSNNRNDNSANKRENFNQPGKKDEPPLHPSWEAKRKLKTTVKAKFQGKRVVFDD